MTCVLNLHKDEKRGAWRGSGRHGAFRWRRVEGVPGLGLGGAATRHRAFMWGGVEWGGTTANGG